MREHNGDSGMASVEVYGYVHKESFSSARSYSLPTMSHDPAQVYQPEADTRLLLCVAEAEVRPGDRVLEIGTGSGLIAETLTRKADVLATDINPHAVAHARLRGVPVIRTDLFDGICGVFDLVIFNPPYLPTLPEERIDDWLEYALDGGKTGRDTIIRFAEGVGRVLDTGGRALVLISSLTGLKEVQDLFNAAGFLSLIVSEQAVENEMLYVLKMVRMEITAAR